MPGDAKEMSWLPAADTYVSLFLQFPFKQIAHAESGQGEEGGTQLLHDQVLWWESVWRHHICHHIIGWDPGQSHQVGLEVANLNNSWQCHQVEGRRSAFYCHLSIWPNTTLGQHLHIFNLIIILIIIIFIMVMPRLLLQDNVGLLHNCLVWNCNIK